MSKPISPFLIRLLAVLIFLATFSGAYLLFSAGSAPGSKQNLESSEPVTTSSSSEFNKQATPAIPSSSISQLKPREDSKTITVRIQIGETTHEMRAARNTTLYTAMEELARQGKITWETKQFGSLGQFVDALNGVKSDRLNGKYWIFYVNGKAAEVGISNYILKNNDLIKWSYEDSQF